MHSSIWWYFCNCSISSKPWISKQNWNTRKITEETIFPNNCSFSYYLEQQFCLNPSLTFTSANYCSKISVQTYAFTARGSTSMWNVSTQPSGMTKAFLNLRYCVLVCNLKYSFHWTSSPNIHMRSMPCNARKFIRLSYAYLSGLAKHKSNCTLSDLSVMTFLQEHQYYSWLISVFTIHFSLLDSTEKVVGLVFCSTITKQLHNMQSLCKGKQKLNI